MCVWGVNVKLYILETVLVCVLSFINVAKCANTREVAKST